MTALKTTFVERLTLNPGLIERDPVLRQRGFVLLVFDAFTRKNGVAGTYASDADERADQEYADRTGDTAPLREHTTVRLTGRSLVPRHKGASAFVFFVDLAPGSYIVQARSPYYQPLDITIALPRPVRWPAFPDIGLADEALPLGSAAQPAAYRAERTAATLVPGVRYPFPGDATLVRGTVRSGTTALAGATVRRAGDPLACVTDAAGGYVLFFHDAPGVGAALTIQATHPLHAPVNTIVQARRGTTVVHDITMV